MISPCCPLNAQVSRIQLTPYCWILAKTPGSALMVPVPGLPSDAVAPELLKVVGSSWSTEITTPSTLPAARAVTSPQSVITFRNSAKLFGLVGPPALLYSMSSQPDSWTGYRIPHHLTHRGFLHPVHQYYLQCHSWLNVLTGPDIKRHR